MEKRVISLFLAFVMCIMPFSMALASDYTDVIKEPDNMNYGGMGTLIGGVISAAKFIGYAVAIVMLIFVGIKYLTAGAGTKAEVKKDLVPMLVGAVLIIAGVTIVDWIWGLNL